MKAERAAREIASVRQGSKVLAIGSIDVRRPRDLEGAVSGCVQELGQIDYVICGAAGNFLAPIVQLSDNAFKTVLDIDLLGSWNTLKATVPHLLASAARYNKNNNTSQNTDANFGTGGRIIFISATLGYTGVPLQTHAAAAKAGVDALAIQVAIELGPRGITSNVIAPGMIAGTEGADRLLKDSNNCRITKSVPSGRLGAVKDVADATVYLLSHAGSYVNGEILVGKHADEANLTAKN
ncbi:peroxisomal 2 4-dienoyl-CoA reductase sps19 [Exophiala xenobiotica]|nr:peroxisomal 2 4-dienoyl-CoA reductase sps19 [Exophiala xenobiotica]